MIRRPPTLLVPTRGEIEAAWQAARGNKSEVVLCECLFYICNYLCLTICTEAITLFFLIEPLGCALTTFSRDEIGQYHEL